MEGIGHNTPVSGEDVGLIFDLELRKDLAP